MHYKIRNGHCGHGIGCNCVIPGKFRQDVGGVCYATPCNAVVVVGFVTVCAGQRIGIALGVSIPVVQGVVTGPQEGVGMISLCWCDICAVGWSGGCVALRTGREVTSAWPTRMTVPAHIKIIISAVIGR